MGFFCGIMKGVMGGWRGFIASLISFRGRRVDLF